MWTRLWRSGRALEPAPGETTSGPEILPLIATILLGLDATVRYLDLYIPGWVSSVSHHVLAAVSVASLLYVILKTRRIASPPDGLRLKTGASPPEFQFAFSRGRRTAAKILIIPVLAVYGAAVAHRANQPPALTLASESLSAATHPTEPLVFDLVVSNNSDQQMILVQILVITHGTTGGFNCAAGPAYALAPLATYPARFHVRKPETAIEMSPPLVVPVAESALFRVALLPSDVGACSGWTTLVSVKVVARDGEAAETMTHSLSREDLGPLLRRHVTLDEYLSVAKTSPDQLSRSIALKEVGSRAIASRHEEIFEVLVSSLDDNNEGIRRSAIIGLVRLHDIRAAVPIGQRLERDPADDVRSAAAEALGNLSAAQSVPLLGKALLSDKANDVQFYAAMALGNFMTTEAEDFLYQGLSANLKENVDGNVVTSLIKLRSTRAVQPIRLRLNQSEDPSRIETFIMAIVNANPAYRSLYLTDIINLLRSSPNVYIRRHAAFHLRFVNGEPQVKTALAAAAAGDADPDVRKTSGESLAKLTASAS